MQEREVLDWAGFGVAGQELAQQVADDGYRPEIILGIARGGLPVAGSIAYALAVKSCFILNVEYYTGVDQRLDAPVVLPPILNLDEASGARVLITDDVADTGHTLALVRDLCAGKVAETRVAVLYEKPRSVVRSDYVWRRTERWIEFPWSSQPALVDAPTRYQATATSQT
ncbi:MAG: phosphoribosyltransferase [Actinomycetota bacterium]|jgi:hypoxanthine phosphoribosyltransferase|nr:phosphoribosyltransferase [Actinomycetota bacterium]